MAKLMVLFVDGDRWVHQSLQRIVHGRKLPVEFLLVTTAAQAQHALGMQSFDVVVSEAQLPDMDGLNLLMVVQERWPNTLRILMASDSQSRVISSLLVCAHQLLTKPMTPEHILAAIQTASRLRFLLMNSRLRDVAHRLEQLPVVPAVYTELTRELHKETCSNQSLARIVSRDMSLTTAILKVANSSYFGPSRRIDDMLQAVNILGANLLKGLVLSEGVFRPQDPDMYPGFNTARLWDHCLEAAKCCRAVIKEEGVLGQAADDAFLAGLLHDVGKVVLAEGCPEDYVGILKISQSQNRPLAEVEAESLGVTHAQVGAYLLGIWGFSETVVVSIAQHHGRIEGPPLSLLSAVLHGVDVCLHERYVRSSGHASHALDPEMLDAAGGDGVFTRWKETIESDLGQERMESRKI